ncbi:hypothetical protein OSB04_018286 [Centaurea solstitialis]|uniref:Uncharacterized protein n=1 Tax=Centaurea solstitialis TaxID=347529 RepID=A0AA38WMU6_9ASTR|nr:hypothetical protein OSB04_018286 [Centaurea solstitialis]
MQLPILLAAVLVVVAAAMASLGPANAQLDIPCETSCGDLAIEFPFGTKEGCYHNPEFLVTCNRSSGRPIPYFTDSDILITKISTMQESEMEIEMLVAADCYNSTGFAKGNIPSLTLSDFRISTKNMFVAIGCDTNAYISGDRGGESTDDSTGCRSYCASNTSRMTNGSCSGVGCCQVAIPEGMSDYEIHLDSYNNHTHVLNFNPCSYAFVVAPGKYNFSTNNLRDFGRVENMPMLLDWAIGNEICEIARKDTEKFLCKGNTSECDKEYGGPGYRCRCTPGYAGNPYLENNCTNINECEDGNNGGCEHECVDLNGGFECRCPKGYKKDGRGCMKGVSLIIQIVVGTLATTIFLLIFIAWLYLGLKKRKLIKLKEKFFRQNGGIILQQRIFSGEGSSSHHDRAKVFTIEELKRATNNYDETRIIGKGGYGTVYKGVLSDKTTVAIKKSKLVDQTQAQVEQFINEVVILSQINHRNVVKLIGCCLETQVPLLVYEFVSNGTLSDHIHNESRSLALTWDIRLRIATGAAGALSYLHSAASVPIIHRDIKPANILLDDNYVAKVSDFGASKLIPMDRTELATIVQGTLGYLDPEYLQTNQLTDKSDVYSFGVVLVELLTRKTAISFDRLENERNLAMYFLSSLKEGRLFQVLDEHLQLNDGNTFDEIINVSRLAERCLRVKGDERPTMKEVAMELEGILASMVHKHPWVQTTSSEEESKHLLKQVSLNHDYEFTNRGKESLTTFDSINKRSLLSISSVLPSTNIDQCCGGVDKAWGARSAQLWFESVHAQPVDIYKGACFSSDLAGD